jgi:hypothetical protein
MYSERPHGHAGLMVPTIRVELTINGLRRLSNVRMERFELSTSGTQNQRADLLRYTRISFGKVENASLGSVKTTASNFQLALVAVRII